MEAREIRVNNLLMFKKKEMPEGKLLGVVDEIGKNHILGFSFFNPDADLACLIADAEPIPLTEEWLEDFGFEWYDNTGTASSGLYNYKRGDFYLSFYDGKVSIQGYLGYSIQYVHQLQNLYYALTNTELTINL